MTPLKQLTTSLNSDNQWAPEQNLTTSSETLFSGFPTWGISEFVYLWFFHRYFSGTLLWVRGHPLQTRYPKVFFSITSLTPPHWPHIPHVPIGGNSCCHFNCSAHLAPSVTLPVIIQVKEWSQPHLPYPQNSSSSICPLHPFITQGFIAALDTVTWLLKSLVVYLLPNSLLSIPVFKLWQVWQALSEPLPSSQTLLGFKASLNIPPRTSLNSPDCIKNLSNNFPHHSKWQWTTNACILVPVLPFPHCQYLLICRNGYDYQTWMLRMKIKHKS